MASARDTWWQEQPEQQRQQSARRPAPWGQTEWKTKLQKVDASPWDPAAEVIQSSKESAGTKSGFSMIAAALNAWGRPPDTEKPAPDDYEADAIIDAAEPGYEADAFTDAAEPGGDDEAWYNDTIQQLGPDGEANRDDTAARPGVAADAYADGGAVEARGDDWDFPGGSAAEVTAGDEAYADGENGCAWWDDSAAPAGPASDPGSKDAKAKPARPRASLPMPIAQSAAASDPPPPAESEETAWWGGEAHATDPDDQALDVKLGALWDSSQDDEAGHFTLSLISGHAGEDATAAGSTSDPPPRECQADSPNSPEPASNGKCSASEDAAPCEEETKTHVADAKPPEDQNERPASRVPQSPVSAAPATEHADDVSAEKAGSDDKPTPAPGEQPEDSAKAEAAPAEAASPGAAPTEPAAVLEIAPTTTEGPAVSGTVLDWCSKQGEFAHLPSLPEGWIRVRSKSTGTIYYVNVHDGQTTFVEPVAIVPQLPPAHGPAPASPLDLPPGWTSRQARSTGQPYYFNVYNGQAQYDRPMD